MSPTLLELIVAILLVWVAWEVGSLIAPRILQAVIAFWRTSRSRDRAANGGRSEKNITPPTSPGPSPSTHGQPGR